jgi:GTP-binding protein
MKKKLPIVAIIGQTNAGKSALFNRIVGSKDAIVAREAGTTRDNVVRTVTVPAASLRGHSPKQSSDNSSGSRRYARDDSFSFIVVDTAGLKTPEDDFEATIQEQIEDAIASADLILFVKDRTEYPDDKDKNISRKALKSRKPVILVLNKSDLAGKISPDEYLRLGIKDVVETSAEHNKGIRGLEDLVLSRLAKSSPTPTNPLIRQSTNPLRVALIGRPNVGKSNLFNALAGKQQAIVAPVAGTTRDVNRVSVKYHGQNIELLDTAGVRRRGKIEQGIEKFSILRTVAAIEEADICLLLMDVNELNTAVDLSLAGMITEAGKGIIIVVTKWDTISPVIASDSEAIQSKTTGSPRRTSSARDDASAKNSPTEQTATEILHSIANALDFVPYAPVIFTSSVTGKNLPKIFELATDINRRRHQQIPTRKLNDLLQKAVAAHPPAGLKNTLPKMRYIVQTDVAPPWFVIYGANFKHIHWSYKRFLERQMRETFDLVGTPIRFSFRDEKQIRANRI